MHVDGLKSLSREQSRHQFFFSDKYCRCPRKKDAVIIILLDKASDLVQLRNIILMVYVPQGAS